MYIFFTKVLNYIIYCSYYTIQCCCVAAVTLPCLPKQNFPKTSRFPTHFQLLNFFSSHHFFMDSRTAESPMEFEWQHRQPGDANSAFYRVGLQHENKKREHPSIHSNIPFSPQFETPLSLDSHSLFHREL